MPRGFHFPVRQEVWGVLLFEGEPWSRSGLFALGKLHRGVSPEAATQELRSRVARLDVDDPLPRPREANLRRYVDAVLDPRLKKSLLVMMGAVVGVLMAACINVANLRFADALSRRDEIAVRGALGAGRARLFALILGESFLVAAAGTVAGLGLAWALTSIVGRRLVEGGPLRSSFWVDVRLDPVIFAIAATAGVLAALAGGLLPAVWSSRNDRLLPSREPESLPASTATKLIVGGQVAASLVLLLYTGLLSHTALDLLRPELGFDRRGLASAILSTYQAEHDTPEARRAFVERLFVELEAQPEIEAAALASFWPWKTGSARVAVFGDASAGGQPLTTAARHLGVTPGFFATLGLPLLEGRPLTAGDSAAASGELQGVAGAAPVVVSRSFARRHLGEEALGKVIELEAPSARPGSSGAVQVEKRQRAEVVGVVEDVGLEIANALQPTMSRMPSEAEEVIYQAFPVEDRDGGFLLVRGRAASAPPARAIDEAIARVDPRAVALDHETFEETLAVATWTERRLAQLFALFGAATLLLTAAGLYAVVTLIVTRRSREYAIRVALGARPGDVGALVLRSAAASVLIGIALAGPLVVLTGRWIEPFLRGTAVAAPILVASTLLVVIGVAAVAVIGPARRAVAVDPQSTLRST
jgi:predicted permease